MRRRVIALVAAAAAGACQQLLGLAPGTLRGAAAGGAGAGGAAPTCACIHAKDACVWDARGDPSCSLVAQSCNAVTPCPASYACEDASARCLCADLAKCGVACAADADCRDRSGALRWVCDPAGYCQPPPNCLTDPMCRAGEVCRHSSAAACGQCQPTGSGAVGASCAHDGDCRSGACAGVCVARCRSNGDCPAPLVCSGDNSGSVDPICRAFDPTRDCPGCTGAGEYCLLGQCRQGPACEAASDCKVTGSDCIAPTFKEASDFQCGNGPPKCGKNELYLASAGDCLGGPCRQASDCPMPYTSCQVGLGCPKQGGFCARPAP